MVLPRKCDVYFNLQAAGCLLVSTNTAWFSPKDVTCISTLKRLLSTNSRPADEAPMHIQRCYMEQMRVHLRCCSTVWQKYSDGGKLPTAAVDAEGMLASEKGPLANSLFCSHVP